MPPSIRGGSWLDQGLVRWEAAAGSVLALSLLLFPFMKYLPLTALFLLACDAQPPPVWGPDTQRLEVTCFQEERGSMRFVAERSQLSAEQTRLLDGLQIVDGNSECPQDLPSCEVVATKADGHRVSYESIATDA